MRQAADGFGNRILAGLELEHQAELHCGGLYLADSETVNNVEDGVVCLVLPDTAGSVSGALCPFC